MSDPDPQWWLALEEEERIAAVTEYHEWAEIDLPDDYAHSLLHVVVENQIAMGEEAATESVLRRLIDEKLDRHDAVHAITSILINHIHDLLQCDDAAVSNDDYYAELEKLTAEQWLRGPSSNG